MQSSVDRVAATRNARVMFGVKMRPKIALCLAVEQTKTWARWYQHVTSRALVPGTGCVRCQHCRRRVKWTRKVNQLKCIRLNADCHRIVVLCAHCSLLKWVLTGWHFPWKYHLLTQPWDVCMCPNMNAHIKCYALRKRSTIEWQPAWARERERVTEMWQGMANTTNIEMEFKSW